MKRTCINYRNLWFSNIFFQLYQKSSLYSYKSPNKQEKKTLPSSRAFPLTLFPSKSIWCILQQLLHVFNFQISHIRMWELFQMDQMTSTRERISSLRKEEEIKNIKVTKAFKKRSIIFIQILPSVIVGKFSFSKYIPTFFCFFFLFLQVLSGKFNMVNWWFAR